MTHRFSEVKDSYPGARTEKELAHAEAVIGDGASRYGGWLLLTDRALYVGRQGKFGLGGTKTIRRTPIAEITDVQWRRSTTAGVTEDLVLQTISGPLAAYLKYGTRLITALADRAPAPIEAATRPTVPTETVDPSSDPSIAFAAGALTMEVAKDSILREAQLSGQMWLPRTDPGFVGSVRRRYRESGAHPDAVDAVLDDIGRESAQAGSTPGLSWITAFQAVVVLETLARLDGAIGENDHSLLEHFRSRQSQAFG